MSAPTITLSNFGAGVAAEDSDNTIVGQYFSYLLYKDPDGQFDDYYEWVNNSNNSPTAIEIADAATYSDYVLRMDCNLATPYPNNLQRSVFCMHASEDALGGICIASGDTEDTWKVYRLKE